MTCTEGHQGATWPDLCPACADIERTAALARVAALEMVCHEMLTCLGVLPYATELSAAGEDDSPGSFLDRLISAEESLRDLLTAQKESNADG